MEFLNWTILGNTIRSWGLAVGMAALAMLGLQTVRRVVVQRLSALAERTRTEIDDLIVRLMVKTHVSVQLILSAYVGTFALDLPARFTIWIGTVVLIAVLIQIGLWGDGLITFALARYAKQRTPQDGARATTVRAASFVLRLALFTIVLLLALDNIPGVEVTTLIAGLGVGGIAVALAVQNILADLFASLSITLDQPFVIGDFIIVGDYLGTVEHIGLKTTRLRSLSGEQIIMANSDLLNSRIRNYKRMGERRAVFSIGVTYQTPHDKLEKIPSMIRQIVEAQDNTRFDRAHFKAFGDFSLNFEVVYYVLDPDYNLYMDIQQAINLALYERFAKEGVEFAYPTQMLYLAKESAA